ncbi:hypothetical protein [Nocardia salmonicida]|uniref:hypothetical protein n=1 Tax=Nocardia salmonicida TaxID=53431 RepID=UPI00378A8E8C
MPKNQSSAAKRARQAARQGAKYTTALRAAHDAAVEAGPVDQKRIVAVLTVLHSFGLAIPIRVVESMDWHREVESSPRWGVVEAAHDGYLIRESPTSVPPRAQLGEDGRRRWPRVPVPHRDGAGDICVTELPALAWASEKTCWRWVFAHNGWAVETPGDITNGASSLRPGLSLQFEIAQFQSTSDQGSLFGEDYSGGPASWYTGSWCEEEDDARELADAFLAWDNSITVRTQVWEHALIALNDLPVLHYQRDRQPVRPSPPRRPVGQPVIGRPAAPPTNLLGEPEWHTAVPDNARPKYALHVWTEAGGWRTHSWHNGRQQAALAAQALGVGVDGHAYPFGYVSGPKYPRAWDHDWTQDGRTCADLLPDSTHAEHLDQEHMPHV